jgi:hypothetical protein
VIGVFLALALYRLFKPVDEGLAKQMLILGALVSVPIVFANVLSDIAALFPAPRFIPEPRRLIPSLPRSIPEPPRSISESPRSISEPRRSIPEPRRSISEPPRSIPDPRRSIPGSPRSIPEPLG